jgi:hypothetical protein
MDIKLNCLCLSSVGRRIVVVSQLEKVVTYKELIRSFTDSGMFLLFNSWKTMP